MLAALIVVAAVAVRGSLPGAAPPSPDTRPAPHPAATVFVVALLAVSLALIAVAVLARIRGPRVSVGVGAGWSDRYRGPGGRTRWRSILLVMALGVAWLVVVAVLTRAGMPRPGTPRASPPASSMRAMRARRGACCMTLGRPRRAACRRPSGNSPPASPAAPSARPFGRSLRRARPTPRRAATAAECVGGGPPRTAETCGVRQPAAGAARRGCSFRFPMRCRASRRAGGFRCGPRPCRRHGQPAG